jgi:hypothetical protein
MFVSFAHKLILFIENLYDGVNYNSESNRWWHSSIDVAGMEIWLCSETCPERQGQTEQQPSDTVTLPWTGYVVTSVILREPLTSVVCFISIRSVP